MPYLIDGHNLIPKLPGLSLEAIDDEIQLIQMLQEFCQPRGKRVEVYFDNAPPGQDGRRSYGPVSAYFVRRGGTADSAIRARLRRLGRAARNWTVVSSDAGVQSAARAFGARTIPSEAFARLLLSGGLPASTQKNGENGEQPPGSDEIQDWLRLFGAASDDE